MPACTPPAALALRLGRATADRAPESPRRAAAICLTRRSAPAALLYVCAVYVLCVRCVCASHARYRGPATLLLLQGLDLLCASGSAAAAATASEASQRGGLAARMAAALLSSLRAAPPSLLVVGAARRPRALPAGLRAHGGFETLMELPPPSAAQRRQLLHRLLGQLGAAAPPPGVAAGVEGAAVAVAAAGAAQLVEHLVGRTGGFTPGDLRALLRAATTRAALRRTGAGAADASGGGVPCWDDCAKALQHAAPSARGDFGDPLPLTSWSDVGGYAAQRARLQRLVEWPQAQGGHSRRLGVEPPSGALLYGPSGNGKSLLVHALASSCGCTVLSAKGSQLFGEYVGDAEASIRALFQQAREAAPAIVFIDEIDALGAKRGAASDGGDGAVAERALSTLLNEVDGVGREGARGEGAGEAARSFVFLLGCSSRPEMIDAALLRPGRMEQLIYVPPPDAAHRRAVLAVHAAGLPLAAPLRLDDLTDELAARTERFSCAALAALVREAALRSLARHMPGMGAGDLGGDLGDGWDSAASEEDEIGMGPPKAAEGAAGAEGATGAEGAEGQGHGRQPPPGGETAAVVTPSDFEEALRFVRKQVLPRPEFDAVVACYAQFAGLQLVDGRFGE